MTCFLLPIAVLLTTSLVSHAGVAAVQSLTAPQKSRMSTISRILIRSEVRLLGKSRRFANRNELVSAPTTAELFRDNGEAPLLQEFRATDGASSKEYLLEIELFVEERQPALWIILIHRQTGAAIKTGRDGAMVEGRVKRGAGGQWDPATFQEIL